MIYLVGIENNSYPAMDYDTSNLHQAYQEQGQYNQNQTSENFVDDQNNYSQQNEQYIAEDNSNQDINAHDQQYQQYEAYDPTNQYQDNLTYNQYNNETGNEAQYLNNMDNQIDSTGKDQVNNET